MIEGSTNNLIERLYRLANMSVSEIQAEVDIPEFFGDIADRVDAQWKSQQNLRKLLSERSKT